ncbi:uncharacterized protein LOC105431257 [Pogonomyrmex barbatus]|uniref:Uncharacterized protein LOC105431257 n=1 Tax=Pogonomyrmex barbatus TaxID=144034 RepID=A0A6I9XEP6_9HYME|nr:uncharacterized protein LOC105431257 [Pogonomyrmex barbatus]
MNGTKLFVCNIIIWLVTSSKLLTQAEERLNSQISLCNGRSIKVFPGIKFFLEGGKINIHMRVHELLQETEVQTPRGKNKENPLQRLGLIMMMTPLIMQILSLPGAIATIKMSLLRSIIVAQLAIAIMIYNLIQSSQNSEVVVIHQPHHHAHYYHNYPDKNDDEDEWFGR